MDMQEFISTLETIPECIVYAPAGLPRPSSEHVIPADLRQFYELSGGCTLFERSQFPIVVVPPQRLRLANPEIVGEVIGDDVTSSWYIIAEGGSGENITIDLHPDRIGRCYDSFWDRHGIPGSCPVIAGSFTELLSRLLKNEGRPWYWLQPEFVSLGDAYD